MQKLKGSFEKKKIVMVWSMLFSFFSIQTKKEEEGKIMMILDLFPMCQWSKRSCVIFDSHQKQKVVMEDKRKDERGEKGEVESGREKKARLAKTMIMVEIPPTLPGGFFSEAIPSHTLYKPLLPTHYDTNRDTALGQFRNWLHALECAAKKIKVTDSVGVLCRVKA